MTHTGTIAAAREADRLFCITNLETTSGPVAVPVTWAEVGRDDDWAARVLRSHGVESDRCRVAAVVSACEDVAWICPFEHFLIDRGITYVGVDGLGMDVNRLAAYLRRLPVDLVLGLDGASLDGLAALEPLDSLLGDVQWIFARPDAVGALRATGLTPRIWTNVGPAVAVECPRGGLHVDAAEWQVEPTENGAVISARQPRGLAWERLLVPEATALPGTCPCGSPDPLVRVALPTGPSLGEEPA